MSQQKVDNYKKEKANRKVNLIKEKRKRAIIKYVSVIVVFAVVFGIGYAVGDSGKYDRGYEDGYNDAYDYFIYSEEDITEEEATEENDVLEGDEVESVEEITEELDAADEQMEETVE